MSDESLRTAMLCRSLDPFSRHDDPSSSSHRGDIGDMPPGQVCEPDRASESVSRIPQHNMQRFHPNDERHFHTSKPEGLQDRRHEQDQALPQSSRPPRHPESVKKRIGRACDRCNRLRRRCDGKQPCAHCMELDLQCEYLREQKKRGKPSRKVLAERAAAAKAVAATPSPTEFMPDRKESAEGLTTDERDDNYSKSHMADIRPRSGLAAAQNGSGRSDPLFALGFSPEPSTTHVSQPDEALGQVSLPPRNQMDAGELQGSHSRTVGIDEVTYQRRLSMTDTAMGDSRDYSIPIRQSGSRDFDHSPFTLPGPLPNGFSENPWFGLTEVSPLAYQPASSTHPEWQMPMFCSQGRSQTQIQPTVLGQMAPRYPVLRPLLPHISDFISADLACDMLDIYFASSPSADMHPLSSYVLVSVFRKESFLHSTNPRECQPALLASMIWVAAQTEEVLLLGVSLSLREIVCQRLLGLTVALLRPANGGSFSRVLPCMNRSMETASPGALAVDPLDLITISDFLDDDGEVAHSLDDLLIYVQLATIASRQEHRGGSLRWWSMAWSLARELKLGHEVPPKDLRSELDLRKADMDAPSYEQDENSIRADLTEEQREERRRAWWLVYMVDRHLALCYNRPLFLLDVECEGLRQPLEDTAWREGNFLSQSAEPSIFRMHTGIKHATHPFGAVGPQFECRGRGIFGHLLPLMTILGEIVDLQHARNHPTFGSAYRESRDCNHQISAIRHHLEIYEQSLLFLDTWDAQKPSFRRWQRLETGTSRAAAQQKARAYSESSAAGRDRASTHRVTNVAQKTTALAYGKHIMHVLYILLEGKWDPISLLNDEDGWTSSPGFLTASEHAIAAAATVSDILKHDSHLGLMPSFFGVYLLQGSFILPLIADRLQDGASPAVVVACETIVHALEVCVATISPDYQHAINRIMRDALAVARGDADMDNLPERAQRRRELLGLYRWTGDSTGLAT